MSEGLEELFSLTGVSGAPGILGTKVWPLSSYSLPVTVQGGGGAAKEGMHRGAVDGGLHAWPPALNKLGVMPALLLRSQ